jgi:GT2 family glycosyltransferase/glycosyltransferase involved in cell wall biosynthesis
MKLKQSIKRWSQRLQEIYKSLVRLIRRAFVVLKKEGVAPFIKAIIRKIFFFFGIHPGVITLSSAIKAITTGHEFTRNYPSSYDVIFFPIIDWDFRFQRPQQLAIQYSQTGHRVYYISTSFQEVPAPIIWPITTNIFGVILPGSQDLNIYSSIIDKKVLSRFFGAFKLIQHTVHIFDAVCIVDLPFWQPLVFKLSAYFGWKIIYDCMDYHAGFTDNSDDMIAHEIELVKGSDLVLATSRLLYNEMSKYNEKTTFIPNAADFEHFRKRTNEIPVELTSIRRPIVGYYGAIAEWFDIGLLEKLAEAKPELSFVLIGDTGEIDLSNLRKKSNIHIFEGKPYSILPDYLQSFDLCIIPFKKTSLTDATNPVKLFEYLCAGKPVLTSNLDELTYYSDYILIADTFQTWIDGLSKGLGDQSEQEVARRVEFARINSWEARFQQLNREVLKLFPKVSILIVTYNNLNYNRLCIQSIYQKTTYPNFEIIIVDNASRDETPAYLQEQAIEHDNLSIILNKDNRGFAAANNQAAELAQGEYLVFLNNDTVVTYGWLSGLLSHLSDPEIGMVGPVTNWAGNESRIPVEYQDLSEMENFAQENRYNHKDETLEVPMLAFFCVAMRHSVWKEVGPLDEQFGIGMFEDDDYALRVKQKNLRTLCVEDVFIHHWGRASFSKIEEEQYKKIFDQNLAKFEAKWKIAWVPHQGRKV